MTESRATPNHVAPMALAVGAIAVLTVMDAVAKHLSAGYSAFELVVMRFAIQAVLAGALVLSGRSGPIVRPGFKAHAGRALLTIISTNAFFYGIAHLPLAPAFALSMTGPVFILLFGVLILGERTGRGLLAAVALAFVGMVTITLGLEHAGTADPVAIAAAIASPVAFGLGIALLRRQALRESPAMIVLVQSTLVALGTVPLAWAEFRLPATADLGWFAAMGGLGVIGHLTLVWVLARIPASRYSVVEYTGLLWAAALGWLVFSEVPGLPMWAGGALIIGGCGLALRAKAPAAA